MVTYISNIPVCFNTSSFLQISDIFQTLFTIRTIVFCNFIVSIRESLFGRFRVLAVGDELNQEKGLEIISRYTAVITYLLFCDITSLFYKLFSSFAP